MKRANCTTTEVLFLCAYAIYVVAYMINYSLIEMTSLMRYIRFGLIILLVFLFLRMYATTRRRLVYAAIVWCVFMMVAYFSHQTEMMLTMTLLICAKAAPFKRIVWVSFLGTLVTTALIMCLSMTGVIPDYTYWRETMSTMAHSYGFGYYSAIPFIFLFLMMGYMYLRERKLSWLEIVIFFALSYYVFVVFTTRLILVLSLFCLIIYILIVKLPLIPLRTAFIGLISKVGFTVCAVISIALARFYDPSNPMLYAIDEKIMNTRLANGAEAFHRYPVSLVGQIVEMTGNTDIFYGTMKKSDYFYVDCGFVYSFICYGVIFTILVIVLYTWLMDRSRFHENKMLFVWVTVVMFFTVINNTWLTVAYNPILFALPALVTDSVKERILERRKKKAFYRTFHWG